MRGNGISYDTGLIRNGASSREPFDPEVVRRELRIIRDDLHCNAVRVIGGDPGRLELAATCAADLGLEVWFSPYPLELTTDEMLSLFADCAERAERLRRRGAEVVSVTGAELSLMNRGFLPGGTFDERVEQLLNEPRRLRELIPEVSARVDEFLDKAAGLIRKRFGGKVTYAAIQLERVDWTRFDIVSMDLYRSIEVADQFTEGVRALVALDKPVAITEFGVATYRGAGDRGARGLEIVEYDKDTGVPVRLRGEYVRDEEGQATYLRELLEVFEAEGVDSAFVFTFALHDFRHRPGGDPARTWTWPASASSGSSKKTATARHTPTWPGNPRPPSGCSRTTTVVRRMSSEATPVDELTIDHPRWREFIDRLEQRLDFRERGDKPGDYQWLCGKGEDPFAYSREVLTAMGLQPEASLATIRSQRHVCCDCEIIFNLGATSD